MKYKGKVFLTNAEVMQTIKYLKLWNCLPAGGNS